MYNPVISGMLAFFTEKSQVYCLKYPCFGHKSMLLRLKQVGSFSVVMGVSIRSSKTLLVIDNLVESLTAAEILESTIEQGSCYWHVLPQTHQ